MLPKLYNGATSTNDNSYILYVLNSLNNALLVASVEGECECAC